MQQTVLRLLEPLLDEKRSFRLFTDNLFGSLELAREFYQKGVGFVMALKPTPDAARVIQIMNELLLNKGDWTASVEEVSVKVPAKVGNHLFNTTHSLPGQEEHHVFSNIQDANPYLQNLRVVPYLLYMYNQCINSVDKINSVLQFNEHKSSWSPSFFKYLIRLVETEKSKTSVNAHWKTSSSRLFVIFCSKQDQSRDTTLSCWCRGKGTLKTLQNHIHN